jgi:hypothetical protein
MANADIFLIIYLNPHMFAINNLFHCRECVSQ